MYVLISHSEPLGKPTGLKIGAVANSLAVSFGEYLGEYSFNDLQVPLKPTLVSGKINQLGFPIDVDTSNINCKGYVKLKSL